jgi:predicted PurR-regulated permease PerM
MKLTRRHAWIFLAVLTLAVILWVIIVQWDKLASLFRILMIGIIIAYILTPLCEMLERKMRRIWAITGILLVIAGILSLFVLFFIPRLIDEVLVLVDRFPSVMKFVRGVLSNIQYKMEAMGIPDGIRNSIVGYADTFQEKVTEFVMSFLERFAAGASRLPALFIELILGFYFLKDREYFARILTNIIPIRSRRTVLQVASEINHILNCFIRGEVLIGAAVGTLVTAGYLLIGLPYALILGFLAAVLEFIPYFGPWLGAVPALAIAYIAGSGKLLWTIAVIILVQQLENAFITPRILSGVVNLHPVYIILSLWAGGLFFGVVGMFLAVPAVLILRVIIKHIYLGIVAIK